MRWNQDKVDDILLPVLKRMNMRESQTQKKITQFLAPAPILTSLPTKQKRAIKSKRIRNVVARLTTGTSMYKCAYYLVYSCHVHVCTHETVH